MSTAAKLRGSDFDSMVERGAFDCGEHRPEPDLVWIRRLSSRRIRPRNEDVLLLIEVSDSSLKQDLGEKAELYAVHCVLEYWVVDLIAEQVHVHRSPIGGRYSSVKVFSKPAWIAPISQPLVKLELSELFDWNA